MELFYLYGTINEVESKNFYNRNSLLLLVDPSHKDEKQVNFGINTFSWKYDEVNKVMGYSAIPHQMNDTKITGLSLHSNITSSEELLLYLNKSNFTDGTNFKEIMDMIKISVDEELRQKPNTSESFNNSNLHHLKRQCLIIDRFLAVFEHLLETMQIRDQNYIILNEMEYLISEVSQYLDCEDVQAVCQKEFRENQIIDSLTNLLNVQVRLTEKINKFNL